MKYDIGDLLSSWPFDPDEFIARRITARDGTEKIQIRIDMGVLQLDMQGRPDGQRPHGCGSLLEFHTSEVDQTTGGNALDEDACEDLFQEAWQYYQRYLSLFYLEDYEGVVRDTEHNLQIFQVVEEHASNDDVKWYFEQYYPHAIMMQARAQAMMALDEENYRAAMREVKRGIERIDEFVTGWEGEVGEDDFPELSFLRDWYEELEQERPLSRREQLERALTLAVEAENFEEAARLRDKLRTMTRPAFRAPNPELRSSSQERSSSSPT